MKKPEITIIMRRFRVALRSRETGEECQVYLTLDKDKLQAAQLVGESSKELLERIAARNGYELLNIIGNRTSCPPPSTWTSCGDGLPRNRRRGPSMIISMAAGRRELERPFCLSR